MVKPSWAHDIKVVEGKKPSASGLKDVCRKKTVGVNPCISVVTQCPKGYQPKC
jgi:hypothetical protein